MHPHPSQATEATGKRASWRDAVTACWSSGAAAKCLANVVHDAAAQLAAATAAWVRATKASSGTGTTLGTMAQRFKCKPLGVLEMAHASTFDTSGFTHKIYTKSPQAQALFDRGLLLAYNFDQMAALAAFKEGLIADRHAPMLYWGIAYASGPFLNKVAAPAPADMSYPVFMPQDLADAQQALRDGKSAVENATASGALTDEEKALLEHDQAYVEAADRMYGALSEPYGAQFDAAMKQYAVDLEAVAEKFADDADAAALAAEMRMNLNPWIYWRKTPEGPYKPRQAAEVVTPAFNSIRAAFEQDPTHPLAAHLMVHLAEGARPAPSAEIAKLSKDLQGFAVVGEHAADVLLQGGPEKKPRFPRMGHLTHMASHLYFRVGRWHDGVVANVEALQADEAMAKRCIDPYFPVHNANMLQFAAGMAGELALGELHAQQFVKYPEVYGPTYMSDGKERSSRPLLLSRYARWEQILRIKPKDMSLADDGIMLRPPTAQPYVIGALHYARAMAFAAQAAKGHNSAARSSAEAELAALADIEAALPDDPITKPSTGLGIFSPGYKHLSKVALLVGGARLAVLDGNYEEAASKLRAAQDIVEAWGYDEPPRQLQPVLQCLGYVLLKAGKLAEAEQVYLEDLGEYPANGFSLKGLQQVYAAQQAAGGESAKEAAMKPEQVQAQFKDAWKHADAGLDLDSSCPAFSVTL